MKPILLLGAYLKLLSKTSAASTPAVKPFAVNLSSRAPHILDLIEGATLPAAELTMSWSFICMISSTQLSRLHSSRFCRSSLKLTSSYRPKESRPLQLRPHRSRGQWTLKIQASAISWNRLQLYPLFRALH